jgi:hypothetical protein
MTTGTFARIWFYLYRPSYPHRRFHAAPEPARFFITAATIIRSCELVFRLVRAL